MRAGNSPEKVPHACPTIRSVMPQGGRDHEEVEGTPKYMLAPIQRSYSTMQSFLNLFSGYGVKTRKL